MTPPYRNLTPVMLYCEYRTGEEKCQRHSEKISSAKTADNKLFGLNPKKAAVT
jgi:hypothetical protein